MQNAARLHNRLSSRSQCFAAARTLDYRFITYDRPKVHKIRSFAQNFNNRIYGQSKRTFLFLNSEFVPYLKFVLKRFSVRQKSLNKAYVALGLPVGVPDL
jgi:hypothetical protein